MRPRAKYAVIYRPRNEYPVSIMCRFFRVSRSGYYDFVHRMGRPKTVNLVLDTIRLAMRREKKRVTAELQLHSDQGFQYTSQAYFNLTKSYGITPSMSRRANPYDNAMAGSVKNFSQIGLQTPFRMVCRDFILSEICKPCLFLSSFQFAKLILPYHGRKFLFHSQDRAYLPP